MIAVEQIADRQIVSYLTIIIFFVAGIEFKVQSEGACSINKVKHGPVYKNKTLIGGMKAGNFSYLGKAK